MKILEVRKTAEAGSSHIGIPTGGEGAIGREVPFAFDTLFSGITGCVRTTTESEATSMVLITETVSGVVVRGKAIASKASVSGFSIFGCCVEPTVEVYSRVSVHELINSYRLTLGKRGFMTSFISIISLKHD